MKRIKVLQFFVYVLNNEFVENQKITVSYISKRTLDFYSSEIAGFNCSSITTETTGEEIFYDPEKKSFFYKGQNPFTNFIKKEFFKIENTLEMYLPFELKKILKRVAETKKSETLGFI
jgi:hypothetical protein